MIHGDGCKKGETVFVEARTSIKNTPITDKNIIGLVAERFTGIDLDGDMIIINGEAYFINVRESVLFKC